MSKKVRYRIVYLILALALVLSFVIPQDWLDEHEIALLLLVVLPLGLLVIYADNGK